MSSRLLQQQPRRAAPQAGARAAASGDAAGLQNMMQLIQLRWFAVIGQIGTIVFVQTVFRINLPLKAMSSVLACLVALNLISLYRWRTLRSVSNGELLGSLLLDVAALTALLYLSGGATNPCVFL